jgi:2-polyprenyl-3-methyl-5-hydroxy-6-metoxy-1,4-benzoquinol methylase
MHEPPIEFDAESVTRAWDRAAEAYAHGQATGRDYYRYEFLGPAHVAACGDVKGLQVLDVGSGAGYFAREMALRGARVIGVDISPRMIEHAQHQEAVIPLGIQYREIAGDELDRGQAIPAITRFISDELTRFEHFAPPQNTQYDGLDSLNVLFRKMLERAWGTA